MQSKASTAIPPQVKARNEALAKCQSYAAKLEKLQKKITFSQRTAEQKCQTAHTAAQASDESYISNLQTKLDRAQSDLQAIQRQDTADSAVSKWNVAKRKTAKAAIARRAGQKVAAGEIVKTYPTFIGQTQTKMQNRDRQLAQRIEDEQMKAVMACIKQPGKGYPEVIKDAKASWSRLHALDRECIALGYDSVFQHWQ